MSTQLSASASGAPAPSGDEWPRLLNACHLHNDEVQRGDHIASQHKRLEAHGSTAEWMTEGSLAQSRQPEKDTATPSGGMKRAVLSVITALATVACTLVVLAVMLAFPLRSVPDFRAGRDYRHDQLEALAADAQSGQVFVGSTRGLETIRQSEFLRHYDKESTRGGLLEDHVQKVVRGIDGRIYILCSNESDKAIGLCRFNPAANTWEPLVRTMRFPELAATERTARITAVLSQGDSLLIGTDSAGLARYSWQQHGWQEIFRAGTKGLKSNVIHDLLLPTQGGPLAATDKGLQQFTNGVWSDLTLPTEIAVPDIRQLAQRSGTVWLRTATGGLYSREGEQWNAVATDTSWDNLADDRISHVLATASADQWWFLADDNRLARYELPTRAWKTLQPAPAGTTAIDFHPALDGRLLAATSEGISELSADGAKWTALPITASAVVALSTGDQRTVAALSTDSSEGSWAAVTLLPTGTLQTLVGSGEAVLGPKGALAVTTDSSAERLFVGGEQGLNIYDLTAHDWRRPTADAVANGSIIELQTAGNRQLVLRADGTLHAWDPVADQAILLLGGGQLPERLTDVTAVTRGTDGNLYLAASTGLFVYETRQHAGRKLAELEDPVSQMTAAAGGVWLLAEGKLSFCDASGTIVPAAASEGRLTRIFSSPESITAIALDDQGRVFRYSDPAAAPALVVGDAARNLDLSKVDSAAADSDWLVVGGPEPSVYETRSRHWRPLSCGQLLQVVLAGDVAWLRTSDRRVFRLSKQMLDAEPIAELDQTVQLSSHKGWLAARKEDSSIWSLTPGADVWNESKPPAFGPPRGVLGSKLLVAGSADHIDLANEGAWWRFSWPEDCWQVVEDDGNQLGVIKALTSTGGITHAIGQDRRLYGLAPGIHGKAAVVIDDPMRALRSSHGRAAAVDEQYRPWRLVGGVWQAEMDAPLQERGDIRDVAATADGLVVATGSGTALLDNDLAAWKPISASETIERLYTSAAKVHASTVSGQLWTLSDEDKVLAWQGVRIDGKPAVARSIAAGAGPASDRVTFTTKEGAVWRLDQLGNLKLLRQPSIAPGKPADVVDIVPLADGGVLAATGSGRLLTCSGGSFIWSELHSSPEGFKRLVRTEAAGGASAFWLLANDGELSVSPGVGPSAWTAVEAGVDQIAAAGDELLAWSESERTLTTLRADGTRTVLISGLPPFPASFAGIVAAGELPANGRRLLLLSDGQQVSAYDPQLRAWTSFDVPARVFYPIKNGAVAFTADSRAFRLEWTRDRVTVAPHPLPPGIVPVAAIRESGDVVGRAGSATLVLVNAAGEARTLVARNLPLAVASGQIAHVAGDNEILFVALQDGQLFAYRPADHQWQQVGKVSGLKRVEALGDELWTEGELRGEPSFGAWSSVGAEGWRFSPVAKRIQAWHVAADGIVAITGDGGGAQRYVAPGQPTPIVTQLAAGPAEVSIAAARANGHGLWLRDDADALFHYDRVAHAWRNVSPAKDAKLRTIAFRSKKPLIADRAGKLWLGERISRPDRETWSFKELAAGVRGVDAEGERAVWWTSDRLVTATFDEKEAAQAERKQTRAWTKDSKTAAAAARASELWIASDGGEVARFDLDSRVWTAHAAPRNATHALAWVNDQLLAASDDGVSHWDGKEWVQPPQASQATFGEGKSLRSIHPHGGFSREKPEDRATLPPPRELSSTEPRRIVAGEKAVWLEMADGSLLHYDPIDHRLRREIDPPNEPTMQRIGLVAAGEHVYFVAEQEHRVVELSLDGSPTQIFTVPKDFSTTAVRISAGEIGLDSGTEVLQIRSTKRLAGAERDAWLQGAEGIAADRMQTAENWRIDAATETRPAGLSWKIGGNWHPVAVDASQSRFAWDDVHGGLQWQAHTLVATAAGVAVYSETPAGVPNQLLAIEPTHRPLKLHLTSFDDHELFVVALDGRVWQLVENESDRQFQLEPIEQPDSLWGIEREESGVKLSAQLGGDDRVPLSLSAGGVWGIDQIDTVALAGGRLYAATADGLLELSLDLSKIVAVHRLATGRVLSNADGAGVLFRTATGEIERFDGAQWQSEAPLSWQLAVDRYALRERTDRAAPIVLPLSFASDGPIVSVEYRARRLICDAPAEGETAILTADKETTWIGNQYGVLALPRSTNAADMSPRTPQFASLLGGCLSLHWDRRSGTPALYAIAGDKRQYRFVQDSFSFEEAVQPGTPARTVQLAGKAYQLDIGSGIAAVLSPVDRALAALTLDLQARAFRHDIIEGVGGGDEAVWLVTDGQLECIRASRPESSRFAVSDAQAIQFRRRGDSLIADTGKAFYELNDIGEPKALNLSAEDAAEMRAGLVGSQWRWPRLNASESLYLSPGRPSLRLQLDARKGFSIDQISRFVAHGDQLVVDTAAGLLRMPVARLGLDEVRLMPLAPSGGVATQVQRFWIAPDNRLWAQTAVNGWQRFQPTDTSWEHFDVLPAAEQAAEGALCKTRNTAWRRGASGLEAVHKPVGAAKELVLRWSTDGQFDLGDVRAAAEIDQSVWLRTVTGLWETDAATGDVLNSCQRPEFSDCEGEFFRRNNEWHVALTQGKQAAAEYRLVDGAWLPAAQPKAAELVWQRPNFRVSRTGSNLDFELRTQPGDQWVLAEYKPRLGRFSFQIAGDAGLTPKHLHCVTPLGLAVWSETAFGLAFDHLRRDLRGLRTDAATEVLLAEGAQASDRRSFDGATWSSVARPIDDSLLLATARWRCVRQSDTATIQVQDLSGAWFDLPLAEQGDFAYRRPSSMAVGDGRLHAISGEAIASYNLQQNKPAQFTSAPAVAANLSGPLSDAFYESDTLHVVADNAVFAQVPDGGWKLADSEILARRARTLLSAGGWKWIRGENSSYLARDTAGQELPWEWDSSAGRFEFDLAADAAVTGQSLLLSTPKGILQLDATSQSLSGLLAHEGPAGRFAVDRHHQQLLFRSEVANAAALKLDVEKGLITLNAVSDARTAADTFDCDYLDGEWLFRLGTEPQVHWNGLETELIAGRFRHDDFRGMLLDPDGNWWLETPLGAIVYASDANAPRWQQTHSWPSSVPVRLVEVSFGVPTIRSQGKTYRRAEANAGWTRVEGDTPSERILVDTPHWTWSRKDEAITAVVKRSDANSAMVALSASARMPFDKVRTVLADGAVVWLGVDEGIVERRPGESGIGWWHRDGVAADGALPLGKIVRLGRFNQDGDPVPSSAPAALREAAPLFAVNDQGVAWRFESGTPGKWLQVSSDPWQGSHGQWIARSTSLQASRSAAGEVILSCRREAGVPSTEIQQQPQVRLSKGRLTMDIVRGMALTASSNYVSTDAGIVETTPRGVFRRWWPTADSASSATPTPWRHIAVHGSTKQVFGIDHVGHIQSLDPDVQAWRLMNADDTFQRTAEVLHSDSFWSLRKWNNAIEISITECDVQPYDGPLFVDGRFSFDVIRDIRLEDEHLWAITAAGVVQYDPERMAVLSLDRRAYDLVDGAAAPLPDPAEFLPSGALKLVDSRHVYQLDGARWQRAPRLPEPFERVFTGSAGRQIKVTPAPSGYGVHIKMMAADGGLIWQGEACQTVPFAELRDMDWLDGELWLATSDRILRWRAGR